MLATSFKGHMVLFLRNARIETVSGSRLRWTTMENMMKFVYYLVWNFIQAISMLHTTPLPTPAVQNAGLMLLCDWLIWVTWKGEELQRQPMQKKQQDFMTRAGQSSPGRNQPIRGCSIGNLKQTERNEVNKEEQKWLWKKENKWDLGKMEDGKNRALRITSKNTDGNKVITIRHSCPNTGQCPTVHLKHSMRTKFTLGIVHNIEYTT